MCKNKQKYDKMRQFSLPFSSILAVFIDKIAIVLRKTVSLWSIIKTHSDMNKQLCSFLMAMCLAGCSSYQMPPFSTSGDWSLQGGTVSNKDVSVRFGETGSLANAFSVNALEGPAEQLSYADCIMKADACFMKGDYLGASNAFDKAFTHKEQIQGSHLYNGACAAAMAGLTDKAFERLNMRLHRDSDWYVENPNEDHDLANIHADERWQAYCDTIARRRDRIEANYDKPLMLRLRSIGRSDQAIRYEFLAAYNAQPRNQQRVDSLIAEMQKTDSINQKEICDILDTRGFAGKETVGDACAVYWLIIQHAPVALQKKYFPLFVEAMNRGDIAKSQVAMMDDRIAMFEGRPQKYGSQIVEDEQGRRVVYRLLDPEKVDEWRKQMELNPLADYMKEMGVEQ